ncbi:hypothetical protein DFQ28_004477 [Apophysomyces sp. BC1034]|nr:hypothetical protein DFQ28_004477 [Apophysomyces sp. BC1034]
METHHEISEEHTDKPGESIRSELVHGIHINGQRANKQAVEIDRTQNVYFYPNSVLKFWDKTRPLPESIGTPSESNTGYIPQKLPLPGIHEFKIAAETVAKRQDSKRQNKSQPEEIHIPRRYILFSPAAIKATKDFKKAIDYALRIPSDHGKFVELQSIFEEFGYYYPYWITTGGKFVCNGHVRVSISRGAEGFISAVFEKKLPWEAFGGDMALLHDNVDIKGWIESTAEKQDLVIPLDINPIYDLLDNKSSSEIQRIYKAQYYQPAPQINALPESRSNMNALVRLSRMHQKTGFVKGVYFDGSQSSEDTIELINESDISKLMRIASIGSEPHIECKVKKSILGANPNTHAFLHTGFPGESANESAFMEGATSHHIKVNGGELQRTTQGVRYFVMSVTYREVAVIKALGMKHIKDKHQELQSVFGRYGYYYPSIISLGGRIVYEIYPTDKPESWLIANGTLAIDRALKRDAYGIKTPIEAIGGSSVITGCQDWINSVKSNQTRILFKTMRPIYELLDEELCTQVKDVYCRSGNYYEDFPELCRGIHFDGSDADSQAIEFNKDSTSLKMMMLKHFSSQPNMEHVKRIAINSTDIGKSSSLDIETDSDFPGTYGFRSAAEGAYNERRFACSLHSSNANTPYYAAYAVCKELHLYDEFIQPTSQFTEAINKALQVGNANEDTYCALQDVFQSFGFYYASRGRISYAAPPEDENEQPDADDTKDDLFGNSGEDKADDGPIVSEITHTKEDYKSNPELENSGTLITVERSLTKEATTTTIANSLVKSNHWNVTGGDSQLLLWNNVNGWINSVKTNQTVIQRKGLKPLYELLDEEQRCKVQQTYENIVLTDDRIHYDYFLEMTSYQRILKNEEHSISPEVCFSTETLFETLLGNLFTDSDIAVKFCRNACKDAGFSIVEERSTEKIICIYCSFSGVSGNVLDHTQEEKQQKQACQWGVMLLENEKGQWEFQKFMDPEESEHNHNLPVIEENNSCEPQQPTRMYDTISPVIVSFLAEKPAYDHNDADDRFVKYGDIVRIRYVRRSEDSNISPYVVCISADEDLKVIRCLPHDDRDNNASNKFTVHNETCEESSNLSQAPLLPDYVRKGDILAFESQTTTGEKNKVYLKGKIMSFSHETAGSIDESMCPTIGWHVQPFNQYEAVKQSNASNSEASSEKRLHECVKQLADDNNSEWQYHLGLEYMYGLRGVDINLSEAVDYLTRAANQGSHEAFYELGKLQWRMDEYQKAMHTFEKGTYFPVVEVCRELGDIYHAGLSYSNHDNHYNISQDYKTAFMYYSIGGILGDTASAMRIGAYLEEGLHDDFGIDRNRALRWYEYVEKQQYGSLAKLAIGKIKHAMANASTDPSEAEVLRQEAYKEFEAAAANETYARFMVAVYHLNGWGCPYHDPTLGFEILLSLVESGLDLVLLGIATCYARGVGVERDPAKASAFQDLAAQMNSQ